MENFRILDPEGDLLVVVQQPTDELFEGTSLVLGFVKIGDDTIPGYLQYEPSQPSSSDNESTCADQSDDQCSYTECARILASSKHLTLASSYLDVELRLDETASTKRIMIPDGVHDVDALWILFSILHCRNKNVPLYIELDMLASVTALAQHFDCVEAVEIFAYNWMHRLYITWGIMYTPDLPQWIWVAWVYRQEFQFEQATFVAIREGTGRLRLWDFNGMQPLFDTIEAFRQEAIGTIIAQLYEHIEAAEQGKYCCGECDALILEKLTQLLQERGLYPRPVPPFEGISVSILRQAIICLGEADCWSLVDIVHTVKGCDYATADVVGTDMEELEELCREVQGLRIGELSNA